MTVGYTSLALAPLAGLATNCAAHVAVAWLAAGGPLRKLLLSFMAGLLMPLAAAVYALAWSEIAVADAIGLSLLSGFTYAMLGYGYCAFVNLNLTSLRIRILQEAWHAPNGLPTAEVGRRYGTEEILRRRIERLTANGQLVQRGGRFYVGKRTFLRIARLIDTARLVVLGSHSVPPGKANLDRDVTAAVRARRPA